MLRIMAEHYSSLKSGVGMLHLEDNAKDPEPLDSIVSEMKPNSSMQNFRDFMRDRQMQINQTLSYK